MSEAPLSHGGDEQVLAEFVTDLERRGSAVVLEWVYRHPHLAREFIDLVRTREGLDVSCPEEELRVPRQLGDFRIVRRVGHGGMGEVYEAVQERLGRRVAVKVIRRGRVSEEARARFLREQQTLARLHQTHIVPIHTAGEEGGLQYFVMPFIDGSALHHVLDYAWRVAGVQPGTRLPPLARLAEPATRLTERPGADPNLPTEPTAGGTASWPGERAKDARVVRLSHDYFVSVARLVADAAGAVQHAHDAGVLHRDLKPSNLMVDRGGQCWIIDFGLAVWLKGQPDAGATEAGEGAAEERLTVMGRRGMGTPGYMAPEQLEGGKVDVRTDVWGLGATLYELLTLRRAFPADTLEEFEERVRAEAPVSPRRLVGNVPPDLAAVCLKALGKEPGERYQSAGEVAAELRRWLAGEPTEARGAWPWRRAWLWARRNKGWAAALAGSVLAIITVALSFALLQRLRTEREVRQAAERLRASVALRREMQQLRLPPTFAGWSNLAWRKAELAAERSPGDEDVRDQAAACLLGIDGRLVRDFDFRASSVAFDAGGRLLMGGADGERARLWDGTDAPPRACGLKGPGPVAFRADGTPLQLVVAPDRRRVLLWDVARERLAHAFDVPRSAEPVLPRTPLLYLAAGGKFVAVASGNSPDARLAVWDARSGKRLGDFPARASALAVSPDGAWVAVGREEGRITVCRATGEGELDLPAGRTEVRCLAFHPDVWRGREVEPRGDGAGWVLVSGDAGGTAVVWDLAKRIPRQRCGGAHHGVSALAMSPDGVTLAVAGLGWLRLFDSATGRPLWGAPAAAVLRGLTFSPDGRRLATTGSSLDGGLTQVWRLEPGRGLRALRGLAGEISKVVFSVDGKRLAALSHEWEVGIWDVESGRLLQVLDVAQGAYADNAALGFSLDGRRFAFASGREATLWDLEGGTLERSWPLPPGFADTLAFGPGGKLLLWRTETMNRRGGKPGTPRRVVRLRNLLGKDPLKPIEELSGFGEAVFSATASPDGRTFLAEGRGGSGGRGHLLAAFDGASGEERWRREVPRTVNYATLATDPTGTVVSFRHRNTNTATLLDMATGRAVGVLEQQPTCLAPGFRYTARPHDPSGVGTGYALYERGKGKPLVVLGVDLATTDAAQFDPSGRLLAWGSKDGTVTVCDIEEVRRRLGLLRLGW